MTTEIGRRLSVIIAAAFALAAIGCGVDPESLTPSFNYQSGAGGCGNIMVFKSNGAGTEYLTVAADKDRLGLTEETRSFDLSQNIDGLAVAVDLYARKPNSPRYCSDVLDGRDPSPAVWNAVAGTVTITLSQGDAAFGELYTATVVLRNIVVRSDDGRQATLPEATFEQVTVGWLPG